MRGPTWYLARLRAMTPREAAWRGRSAVALRLRPLGRRLAEPSWDGAWPEHVRALAETRRGSLVADAERIAAGELELWGRRVEVDPARIDWARDPFGETGDRKPLWELNRQQHLFPLAAGAALAGRDDWAQACAGQMLDWAARRPRDTWDSGYENAHRLVGWAWTAPFLRGFLSPAQLEQVSASYAEQAAFTAARPSLHSSANNHRLAELVGLLAATAVGVDLDRERLWGELERRVAAQTYDDGGGREQAGGYFLYVLEVLWVAAVLARGSGYTLGTLEERLGTMLGWLEKVADHKGEPPPLGDDAEDRFLRVEYFEPRRANEIAGRVRALLDGETTLVAKPVGSARDSVVLPASGLAVFRCDPGTRVVVDVGELGFGSLAAHGHADALSVLLDTAEGTLLRDSGTCAYAPPEKREPYRRTSAHNTVVVDGRSQARARGPHLWGRRFELTLEAHSVGAKIDYVRASHDGYRPARHTRSVTFLKPGLVIVLDRIDGEQELEATLVWQLRPDGPPARLAVATQPEAEHTAGDGPCSPRYTWCMEAPRSTWSTRGREVVFATVIGLEAAPPSPELRHDGATAVELPTIRLVERWQGGLPELG
ncbi:MAG TPA: alginate lyase family protein [Gaiellaceae bacterium]|nr:alginate lyase family protein [Gaiellaceae bacterium]